MTADLQQLLEDGFPEVVTVRFHHALFQSCAKLPSTPFTAYIAVLTSPHARIWTLLTRPT